ncbi:uncharacterized protein BP01DRAFT_338500 [Aspergillus saccharolyticus JOP 1030-1]|uniref:Enoyl reductase (ER) domain-containing protein n=1 Tax=Aspergillus saccharolyticus JOP 1030-1 TaxID=1450539 RepID=A0A318ZQB4_9EURO|nr:hypothetical protein BP01DRAFT_338500 [Aspergillus saccharolyticus JOP 1030-1]PYH46140.1 hypothetical protein BP01DRAFT_338500 [Aspergillus saccharolyticus JOP 1030-1]
MSSNRQPKTPSVLQRVAKVVHAFKRDSSMLQYLSSFLTKPSPTTQMANERQHTVWLFDNTAYQARISGSTQPNSWRAEIVACVFQKDSRKDLSKLVAMVADLIGLDGEIGTDKETRHRIAERLQPFLHHTASSHLMMLETPLPNNVTQIHQIGPTDDGGIICQIVEAESGHLTNGASIRSYLRGWASEVSMSTTFAGPQGWLVISDIDDTIKYTKTSESTGILRTTFVEEPKPIAGMPRLYAHLQRDLAPTWFYLSASPYNLYPFLHGFIHTYFSPGTLILRDTSWLDVSELVKSFSVNTMEYKVDRAEKIHGWFPQRQVLCIGDSTQKDPEAYAELYKRHPDWIQAIWIRKVTDVPHLHEQNMPERFQSAFDGVPGHIWKVFEDPAELEHDVGGLNKSHVLAKSLREDSADHEGSGDSVMDRSLKSAIETHSAVTHRLDNSDDYTSSTMLEQTSVPSTMRALYFRPASTAITDLTSLSAPRVDSCVEFDSEFQTPMPSGNEYLIKVKTAAFSHDELRLATILNPSKSIPQIPLHCFCGTVVDTPKHDQRNPGPPKFKVGDVVFGLVNYTRDGAAADYVVTSEDEIALKPQNISAAEAATIPLPALTAWQSLFTYAGLVPEDVKEMKQQLRVLVTNSRNSEVGAQALQLLRSRTLFPYRLPWVCATCDAEDQEDYLRLEHGIEEVLYAPLPLPQDYDLGAIFRQNCWAPVDLVIDCAGRQMFQQAHSPRVIKDNGAVVTAVDSTPAQNRDSEGNGEPPKNGVFSRFVAVQPDGNALERIAQLVESDVVRGRVESIHDINRGADMLAMGAAGAGGGRRGGMMVIHVN